MQKRVTCSMITNFRKLNINNSLLNLSFPLVFDYECICTKKRPQKETLLTIKYFAYTSTIRQLRQNAIELKKKNLLRLVLGKNLQSHI